MVNQVDILISFKKLQHIYIYNYDRYEKLEHNQTEGQQANPKQRKEKNFQHQKNEQERERFKRIILYVH